MQRALCTYWGPGLAHEGTKVQHRPVDNLGIALFDEVLGGFLQPRVIPDVGEVARPNVPLDYAGHVRVQEGSGTAMYEDLPSSSEQVLHPEKYWKDRDNPTLIDLPLLGKEWDLLTNNVHGEFVVRILLRELKSSRRLSRKASEGWDGDRYHIYEKEDRVSSAWYSTWDSEKDAIEFFQAYTPALRKKQPGETDETIEEDLAKYEWATGEGRSIYIERKGSDVLVINGSDELVGKAAWYWKNATKKELDHVERFKRGSWTCKGHPEVDHDINSYCPKCEARLIPRKKERERKDY